MIRTVLPLALLALAACGGEAPNQSIANAAAGHEAVRAPLGDSVRVRLETEAGPITLELDHAHAPVTVENFVRYVDEHRFDGTTFYRAARTRGFEERGFIQGGIRRNYRRMLPPIAHEPTSHTGIRHGPGTISMARSEPGMAMGEFFITTDAMPQMDAHGSDQGFAAFGHVTEGMEAVRRILAAPTIPNAGSGAMRGQMIAAPVAIRTARRLP
ncbi:MAG: peptidylprolyl isomerase [Alphaproteobacteria bacterium]|nr:MAG: peptidylprolyl isomerase [Alphaproteobacteria bacterium]